MVKPVMCKVCGNAHFGARHVWSDVQMRPPQDAAEQSKPRPSPKRPMSGLLPSSAPTIQSAMDGEQATLSEVLAGVKAKFDRNAYQREYMRKRREGSRLKKGKESK
jgi:hypothetical protein